MSGVRNKLDQALMTVIFVNFTFAGFALTSCLEIRRVTSEVVIKYMMMIHSDSGRSYLMMKKEDTGMKKNYESISRYPVDEHTV